MNVLMVSRGVFSLPPRSSGGGAERHAYELARALARRGHKVHLVTPTTVHPPPTEGLLLCQPAMDGAFIHTNVPFYGWLLKHVLANAGTLQATIRKLKESPVNYDVLHVHSNLNARLLSCLSSRVVPLVCSVHDAPPSAVHYQGMNERLIRESVFRSIDIPALKKADHVISVNPAIKQILTICGVKSERISVIPSGAHIPLHPSQRRDPTLGIFVGQLGYRKGTHLLLQAASEIPEVQLAIVGDGPEKTRLIELSKRLRCSDRVTFHGYLPRYKLEECYAQASFGIFPTLADAMPTLALLECMAYGIPPLVSRVPGADWVIRSGENGLLFEPGNVTELKKLLAVVAFDQNLCRRIGEESRHLVEKSFTWDIVAQQVGSVYKRLVDHKQH